MKKLLFCVVICSILVFTCSAPGEAAVKDFRGVWVSTIYRLDYPAQATASPADLKNQADDILDQCQAMGMNAVILQVRPSADAFYNSSIYPWSKYLTGTQGKAPENGFDPLAYWVTAAHARGLELHAWINPYRVAVSESDYNSLAESNPAKKNKDWVYEYNGSYYFNAGIPEVRQLIAEGVEEILDNYDVDGIHLDDYFYPGDGDYDNAAYEQYKGSFTNKGDWRRNNNDELIRTLYNITNGKGKSFGVSPAGIWANKTSLAQGSDTKGNQTYFSAYADTRKWVKEGWLDYICPQIYWSIGYKIADYQVLANWWADVVSDTDVKLYIGMADYRYASTGSAKWTDLKIIKDQLALNAAIPQITGEVHFRYGNLVQVPILYNLYATEYAGRSTPRLVSSAAYHQSYIQGDEKGFRPEDSLTRAEIATILARLMVDEKGNALFDEGAAYPTSFTDVKSSSWYAGAMGFMEYWGIFCGYGDGTCRPEAKLTRAECATILSRFIDSPAASKISFSDVSNTHWANEAIGICAAQGYVEGYGDNTFHPDAEMTRAEAVTMVNRILGRVPKAEVLTGASGFGDVAPSHWAYYDILEAAFSHASH
ncbi:MAG: family 10 glycosylhydrolase [Bacillota bacterium]|nr:family 10 glycosylhydrolase [Bacillota bacterium]